MNRAFLALALAAAASPALAQDCLLRNNWRIAHAMCDTSPSETRVDTGPVPAGPLVTSSGVVRDNGCGCHSEMTVMAVSGYGSLSYSASSSGNSCQCCGIFIWVDEGDGGAAKARFDNRVILTSPTLPNGTPVPVRVTLYVSGGVSASNASSERTFAGELTLMGAVYRQLRFDNSQGIAVDTVQVPLGQPLTVQGRLYCTLRDYTTLGFNQTGALGGNVSVATTLEVLTPGINASSCSGHDYTTLPCPADLDDGSLVGVPDHAVDINDLLFFLAGFEAGSLAVDLDDGTGTGLRDQAVDINDLIFFLAHFESGC